MGGYDGPDSAASTDIRPHQIQPAPIYVSVRIQSACMYAASALHSINKEREKKAAGILRLFSSAIR